MGVIVAPPRRTIKGDYASEGRKAAEVRVVGVDLHLVLHGQGSDVSRDDYPAPLPGERLRLQLVIELIEPEETDARPESAGERRDPEHRPVLVDSVRQPPAQRVAHDPLERHVQQPRLLLEQIRDVVIQSKRRSHGNTMMLGNVAVKMKTQLSELRLKS